MTQIFDETGLTIPVTVIQAGPCVITQIKTQKQNGYNAVQLGYMLTNPRKLTKAQLGHLKKTDSPSLLHLREYKVEQINNFSLGQSITIHNFEIGQTINISGQSIGKGFSGYQKRHNFKRGPMSHGSKNHRAPGSIGPGTTPGRVFPGKRMAGQHGSKQVTISKIKIVGIDKEQNLLIVKGNVPGKSGNLLNILPAR